MSSLRRHLLAWYDAEKRELPWREDRDPYRIWISEAMLQQTRVETVLPYFARFVERFPSVHDLAAAPVDEVLARWSGLGYYRRARTLHAAARAIVAEHGGRIPADRETLLELPGIGPYTAGAISSIAYDRAEPLVDGNVARVFARVFELEGDPTSPSFTRAVWERARELVRAGGRSGDWNQALMELGALVCTPREPSCAACPIAKDCRALRAGRVAELPWPKPRKSPIGVELSILAVERRGRLLFERRAPEGRMAGLWQLPTIETAGAGRLFPTTWPRAFRAGAELGTVRHTITHHRIRASVRRGTLGARAIGAPYAWFAADDVAALPLTGMAKKVLAARFFRVACASYSSA